MLSIDRTTLDAGTWVELWVLEFDLEYRHVQVNGRAQVSYTPQGRMGPELESGDTGGCYSEPHMIGDVEVWIAEEHRLAVFADEASMRAGARNLARNWGEDLPVGIYRVLEA
jgi:hypothetical protein